jgi:hypothetical protein
MSAPSIPPVGPEESGTRFPFIKLETAMGRAKQLYDAAGEHKATVPDAFQTWGYSEKSSGGNQTISALKMYGIVDDSGYNEQRRLFFTKDGLRYFRDERDDVLAELKRQFALSPPLMRTLWSKWGVNPPADNIARSYLKIDLAMAEQNARTALGIYKENLVFAEVKPGDKMPEVDSDPAAQGGPRTGAGALFAPPTFQAPPLIQRDTKVMAGERELTTGLLSKDASFRLIVSGAVGVKEIERLIKKLELDKEILADVDDERTSDEEQDPRD